MTGLDLNKEFRDYYLKFNLPLQIVAITATIFLSFNIVKVLLFTIFFHILIYWAGIQCGSHKLFSHKSWIPKYKWITYSIGIISCFGIMGGPILWSLMHRWHHAHSDTDLDPHSPKHGYLHSYFTWFLNIPHVPLRIIKDHILDYNLIRIDRNCKKIVYITLLFLTVLDYEIALSLLLAMVITFHIEMSVNCFAHKQLDGEWKSVNYISLAFITGGSTLHANHHADSSNWNFSKKWFELDPSAWIIKCLKK
jgi:fatty-acid desaturase